MLKKPAQEEGRALRPFGGDQRIERLDPLSGLERIDVGIVGVADGLGNRGIHRQSLNRGQTTCPIRRNKWSVPGGHGTVTRIS